MAPFAGLDGVQGLSGLIESKLYDVSPSCTDWSGTPVSPDSSMGGKNMRFRVSHAVLTS